LANILLLDIETAPNMATVWGLFKQNIGINQLIDSSYTLCWAAKWYGESEVIFDSVYQSRPKNMVKRIRKLLDQADAVIHYNGTKFDIPTLNKEFLEYELGPPSPFKQIDLLKTVRKQFRLPSNKLAYVAKVLGLAGKEAHMPHEMWLKCMNKDPTAWAEMEKYNRNDVVVLEQVYDRLRPWVGGHLNFSLMTGDLVCPNCRSDRYTRRGYCYTHAGKFSRHQCNKCGKWFRSSKSEAGKAKFVDIQG
jgi:DNA polymerase elongation subunit (family B)